MTREIAPALLGVVRGQILERVDYNPASYAAPSLVANQITTWVSFDSTNLKITFTAPASGKVRAKLICAAASNPTGGMFWRLATTAPVGVTESEAFVAHDTAGVIYKRYIHECIIPVTPGTSYTWIWQGRNASTSQTANLLYGTSGTDRYGPAVMEIAAA